MVYVDIAHVDVESVSEELVQEPLSDVAQARAPAVWQKIVGLVPVIYAEVSWFWLTQEKIGELVSSLFCLLYRDD